MLNSTFEIIISQNGEPRAQYVLGLGQYLIGRDPSCQIFVDGPDVSHKHALLWIDSDSVRYEDLGSSNGSYIGDQRINRSMRLRIPQTVRIASALLEIKFFEPADAHPSQPSPDGVNPSQSEINSLLKPRKYKMGPLIARGGMGAVHEAEDLKIKRTVAMKVILPAKRVSTETLLRFLQEARVIGKLEHPNIVPIYDLGLDDQGQLFYTMKRVQGRTLHQILVEIQSSQNDHPSAPSLSQLLTIFQKVCDAISFAHSKNVVHRDLKPENIMVGEFGEVLVMDWGLVKILSNDPQVPDLNSSSFQETMALETSKAVRTIDGRIMGTPHYMTPEQAEGRVRDIDERTDIYALGGILYSILTLQPPIKGGDFKAILERIRTGGIRPPSAFNWIRSRRSFAPRSEIFRRLAKLGAQFTRLASRAVVSEEAAREAPPKTSPYVRRVVRLSHCPGEKIPKALSAVAMKALANKPGDRYQTVQELQSEITAYLAGFVTAAEEAGPARQFILFLNRHKTTAAASIIIATLLAGFVLNLMLALADIRQAAPYFHGHAQLLVERHDFTNALLVIDHAITLQPDIPEYHHLKGNICQTLQRFNEARSEYQWASKYDPDPHLAKENLVLCDKLMMADWKTANARKSNLEELRQSMIRQGRSAEASFIASQLPPEKGAPQF